MYGFIKDAPQSLRLQQVAFARFGGNEPGQVQPNGDADYWFNRKHFIVKVKLLT